MDELNNRIVQLMDRLNMNKSAFASEVDVSLPLMTHITSGRNKPGLDLLQKILARFRDVDPLWLLTGAGEMMKKPQQKPDYSGIYERVDRLKAALEKQEQVNNTILKYHKILLDEISHVQEMNGMIADASAGLKDMLEEMKRIRLELESK